MTDEEAAYNVIGSAIDVHRALGPGYLESVYEEALCVELTHRSIPFKRQHSFEVFYRNISVGRGRVDIFVADCLVVELKTVSEVAQIHYSQVVSYLKGTKNRLGLILNFQSLTMKDGVARVVI